ISSGQDGSRVHCLCQGQSRQAQHGIGWRRKLGPCNRRVVQDDDRRRHDSRSVSWRGTRNDRPAWRTGSSLLYPHDIINRVHQSWQAAGARRDHRDALGRAAGHPDVGDFVPGYEASAWFGVGAPRNTPAEIIDKLNKEINAGLSDPALRRRLAEEGGTVFAGSPADFGKFIADETEKWGKVVKFVGIKAD